MEAKGDVMRHTSSGRTDSAPVRCRSDRIRPRHGFAGGALFRPVRALPGITYSSGCVRLRLYEGWFGGEWERNGQSLAIGCLGVHDASPGRHPVEGGHRR